MTTLRVVLDPEQGADPARYEIEMTRHLIESAPQGVSVEAFVPASPSAVYDRLAAELPGLAGLRRSALDRRSLHAMWRGGAAVGAGPMLHALGPHAPLNRKRRGLGDQTIVTVHNAIGASSDEDDARYRSTLRRVLRFADAIVVPNHAVAAALDPTGSAGDRIRVIPAGPSHPAPDGLAPSRADAAPLPEQYLLTAEGAEPQTSLAPLLRGMTRTDGPQLPLVVIGSDPVLVAAHAAGLDPARLHLVDPQDAAARADALRGAEVFVHPGSSTGFGIDVIDAMHAGLPIVHPDDEALVELTAEAALIVARDDIVGYTASLAQHIAALLEDDQTRGRMRTASSDRARAFSWRDAAEKVWQLHADL